MIQILAKKTTVIGTADETAARNTLRCSQTEHPTVSYCRIGALKAAPEDAFLL
jgi:hypothetical protein